MTSTAISGRTTYKDMISRALHRKLVRAGLATGLAAGLALAPVAAANASVSTSGQIDVQYGQDGGGNPVAIVTVHDLSGTCPSNAAVQPGCADWIGLKSDNGDGTYTTVGGTWVGSGTTPGDFSATVPLPTDSAYAYFGIFESYVLQNPAADSKIDWHVGLGWDSSGKLDTGVDASGTWDISQADTNSEDINTGTAIVKSDAGSGFFYYGHGLRTDDTNVNVGNDGTVVITGSY